MEGQCDSHVSECCDLCGHAEANEVLTQKMLAICISARDFTDHYPVCRVQDADSTSFVSEASDSDYEFYNNFTTYIIDYIPKQWGNRPLQVDEPEQSPHHAAPDLVLRIDRDRRTAVCRYHKYWARYGSLTS